MHLEARDDGEEANDSGDFWRRLLHRWLVQYNPLYLLSASLCLAGMILCSRGLAHEGSLHGGLVAAGIAEAYAAALIGGAALLTRIGQRRPAVMLALITALYQCDLTLHTEACAYLGTVGVVAAVAWTLLFVAKLHALAWAVRVRVSFSATATATLGAVGLAVLPRAINETSARGASSLVALWLFMLFALGMHGARSVESRVELDAWGRIVLRRALRAVWLLWSLLLALHVGFWSREHAQVRLTALVPVVLLLAIRPLRREGHVWFVAGATLFLVAVTMPEQLAVTALMTAMALALRAVRRPDVPARTVEQEPVRTPYRAGADLPPIPIGAPAPGFVAPTRAAKRRLFTGALFAAYVAVWTLGWGGGAWPEHIVALDVALVAVVLVGVLRARMRIAIAPLTATLAHFAFQARVVPAPVSTLQWGVASVGLGFALLIASLGASYYLRNVDSDS